MHAVDASISQPRGIIFNALSRVEPPEQPGVPGSTIELRETAGQGQLIETLLREAA